MNEPDSRNSTIKIQKRLNGDATGRLNFWVKIIIESKKKNSVISFQICIACRFVGRVLFTKDGFK